MNKLDLSRRDDRGANRCPTICHVLHSLDVGGAELLAVQIAEQTLLDCRPVFLCLDEKGVLGERLEQQGMTVEVVGRKPGFDLPSVGRLRRFFEREEVDLVHAHQYGPFFYSSLARGVQVKFPILFTEHGRDYPDFRRTKRVIANRILLRRHDRVAAVGKHVKTALIENEGIAHGRIEVIYNGVEAGKFDAAGPRRAQVRRELGLRDSDVAIVQVARLNHLKDFGTAVHALAEVCSRNDCVRYVIIGEGERRRMIEAAVKRLGLQEKVQLLGLRHDVPRLLEGMDLFLLSSISEGIPLTVIEAMLAGLPGVATRVGGNSEVVVDGETGLLANPQDARDIAEKLLTLTDDESRRKKFGRCARERAMLMFQSTKMLESYSQLYCEMLKSAGWEGLTLCETDNSSKVPAR